MLAATAAAAHGTEALATAASSSSGSSLARERTLLDEPHLALLVSGARVGLRQCSAVAGPSLLGE